MKFLSIYNAITITAVWLSATLIQAAVIPLPAANPNPVLNSFTQFDWSTDAELLDQTFAIDLDAPSRVHVTDLDPHGSGFAVYDNGNFVGETATVITKDNPYGAEEYHYRQGFFNLDTGHHVITVKLKGDAKTGSGAIRMVPGVNNEMTVLKDNVAVVDETQADADENVAENADQIEEIFKADESNDEDEEEEEDDEEDEAEEEQPKQKEHK
ncbi:hypothetical protein G6F42_023407 [Rhizopus arrhizus]|nr:hypothetical protein G6F42_023407 [Rhizopus arrhizus]